MMNSNEDVVRGPGQKVPPAPPRAPTPIFIRAEMRARALLGRFGEPFAARTKDLAKGWEAAAGRTSRMRSLGRDRDKSRPCLIMPWPGTDRRRVDAHPGVKESVARWEGRPGPPRRSSPRANTPARASADPPGQINNEQ
jgi:hypothetical protein